MSFVQTRVCAQRPDEPAENSFAVAIVRGMNSHSPERMRARPVFIGCADVIADDRGERGTDGK